MITGNIANKIAHSKAKSDEKNMLHSLTTTITAGDLLDRESEYFKELSYYYSPPTPIKLDSELTLQDACLELIKNKISSAPIVDKNDKMIGILDFKDLAAHVLQVLNDIPMDVESSMYGMTEILASHSKSKGLIKDLPHTKPLVCIKKDTIVHDILEEFVRSDVHRVVVVDEKNEFLGVVSQSTVAALVSGKFGLRKEKNEPFWEKGQIAISEADIIERNVVSLGPSATVMQALFMMISENISSVAIVTGNRLLGSISLVNVKHVLCDKNGWKSVFQRCDDFFKQDRIEQSNARFGEAIVPNLTVPETCSVIRAMEKMVACRAHRLWVVDDDQNIIGLVSLSSMMKLLLQ